MAEWLRQGPAKPCTRVRFPPPPRAISSVGEHYLDTVGVTGSIPVSPTMRSTLVRQPADDLGRRAFLCLWLMSPLWHRGRESRHPEVLDERAPLVRGQVERIGQRVQRRAPGPADGAALDVADVARAETRQLGEFLLETASEWPADAADPHGTGVSHFGKKPHGDGFPPNFRVSFLVFAAALRLSAHRPRQRYRPFGRNDDEDDLETRRDCRRAGTCGDSRRHRGDTGTGQRAGTGRLGRALPAHHGRGAADACRVGDGAEDRHRRRGVHRAGHRPRAAPLQRRRASKTWYAPASCSGPTSDVDYVFDLGVLAAACRR